MTSRPVRLTGAAEAEIDAACEWIGTGSPVNAAKWRLRLNELIASLDRFPLRFPVAAESVVFGHEVRQLVFGSYRVLYTVRRHEVVVLHLRHGARRRLGEEE